MVLLTGLLQKDEAMRYDHADQDAPRYHRPQDRTLQKVETE